MRRKLTWLLVAGVVVASSCVPPEDERIPKSFDEETVMAAVQRAGELRIGMPVDAPPIAASDSGTASGLATGLGDLVAEGLGVDPLYVSTPPETLLPMLDAGELDLAFPPAALTERALRTHTFTNPYVVAHQRLLVAKGSGLAQVEDLAGRAVCDLTDPVTGTDLSALEPTIRLVPAEDPRECVDRFAERSVAAVTGDDLFLGSILSALEGRRGAPSAVIAGYQLSTVGYGAAVTFGETDFATIVERVFADAEADGTWAEIYERWVGVEAGEPPELTAEEAAALFPAGAS